jgi:predicted amino acid racemase
MVWTVFIQTSYKKTAKNKLKYKKKKNTKLKNSSIDGGEATTMHVEHMQESEALTSARVGHALEHGGNVAIRRATIGGKEWRRQGRGPSLA